MRKTKTYIEFINESYVNFDRLEILKEKYPVVVFTLNPDERFHDAYFARLDIMENNEKKYLGALRGPVSKEQALDFFEITLRGKYGNNI